MDKFEIPVPVVAYFFVDRVEISAVDQLRPRNSLDEEDNEEELPYELRMLEAEHRVAWLIHRANPSLKIYSTPPQDLPK
jgi:hypothetical protein